MTAPEDISAAIPRRYRVQSEIGRGGMGIVFRAHDTVGDRDVAIKMLRPEIATMVSAKRFLQEISIDASLDHPNIVPIVDSGDADGVLYCVMPYIPGPTLRQRLADGPLPVDEAIHIVSELASALGHLHAAGFVHRDVKPENVLLHDGRALLLDFGVARAVTAAGGQRLTSEGVIVGTPAYLSPEQASGSMQVDHRSDIYSLAVVLFEMLTGEPPFTGHTAQATAARHMVEIAPPASALRPTVDPGLDAIIHKALAKSPVDRFASTEEFAQALAHRADFAPIARRSSRRWQLAVAAAGVVAATGLVVARPWAGDPVLDPDRVVVFPLPDRAASGDTLRFSTDVPYAIELALDHSAPLRWLHGWDWLDEAVRRDAVRLTGSRMRSLSRRLGAKYYIDGAISREAGGMRLVLQLHDVETDSVLITEGAQAASATADPSELAVQAITKVLLRWRAPGRHEALTTLATRRPGALALQVQGEDEYRKGRFSNALRLFERAIELDSTWGYAAVKAAQTAGSWLSRRDDGIRYAQLALRHPESLPQQYAEFARGLEAYLDGRADESVVAFRNAIALAPSWEEAHMALGEVYYHLLPSQGDPRTEARAAFERALLIDSTFAPAARHLAEIAFREGSVDRGSRLATMVSREQADSETTRTLTLMRDCVRRRRGEWDLPELAAQDPLSVLGAAIQLAAGASQVACSEQLFRVLLQTKGVAPGYSWSAVRGLQGLLITTGRFPEALQLMDSTLKAGGSGIRLLQLVESGELPALDSRAAETAAFGRSRYGDNYERAPALSQWALAVWHARRHDGNVAAIGGDSARLPSTDRVVRLTRAAMAAHAAYDRRDTVEAIALLSALRSSARTDILDTDLFETLAVERILLAELLLAKGRYREAFAAASVFDNVNLAFTPFVARSLAIRIQALNSLGGVDAREYQRRLAELGRAELLGPRR